MNNQTRLASRFVLFALAGASLVIVALHPQMAGAMLFLPLAGHARANVR